MCMITYVPAGVDIPTEGIACSAKINDDGHGFMLGSKEEGLVFFRSMNFEETMTELRERRNLDEPVVFHSRYATHGTTNLYNVHPFYLGDESYDQTGMVHNGILPAKFQPDYKDERSDTRILASLLGNVPYNSHGIPSRRQGKYLAKVIGAGNKLVFMSMKTGAPKVRIVNQEAGVWTDGVWFSNTGYKRSKWTYGMSNRATGGLKTGAIGSSAYNPTPSERAAFPRSDDSEAWRKYCEDTTDRQQADAEARYLHWLAGRPEEVDASDEHAVYRGVTGEVDYDSAENDTPSDYDNMYNDCDNCRNVNTVDIASNYCLACNFCHDCKTDITDCACWVPRHSVPHGTEGTPPF
jgi:predicted glutamine amidotransferase